MSELLLTVIRNRVIGKHVDNPVGISEPEVDDPVTRLVAEIHRRHGDSVAAIVVYGSYLRGKRDTLLDFYVLLENFSNMPKRWHAYSARILAPNVYNIRVGAFPNQARAKYAALSLEQFERAMQRQFHSYFWARFAQPCGIVFAKNEDAEQRVIHALSSAVRTFFRRVAPLMEGSFTSSEFWEAGLLQTYRCELRAESTQQADKLAKANSDYFKTLTQAVVRAHGSEYGLSEISENCYSTNSTLKEREAAIKSWGLRRLQGKFISVCRLLKAATTFENSLEYLLWKIERHSGIYIQPSARQLKYPLIFAWPLLWRLYRLGAFK